MITSLAPSATGATESRRTHLLSAIRRERGTWNSARAARTNADGGWGGNRNTARKDLRSFVRHGDVVIAPRSGCRAYVLPEAES